MLRHGQIGSEGFKDSFESISEVIKVDGILRLGIGAIHDGRSLIRRTSSVFFGILDMCSQMTTEPELSEGYRTVCCCCSLAEGGDLRFITAIGGGASNAGFYPV